MVFSTKKGLLECKPEWNREAVTVFSRLPSLRRLQATTPLQTSLTIGTKILARGYTSVNFYGKLVYNPIGAGCFARFEFPHLLQTSNIYDPRDVAVLRRLVEERTDSLYEQGIYGGKNEGFRDFTPPGDDILEPDLVPELLNNVEILSPTKCFKNRGVQYEKKKVAAHIFRNS